MSDQVREPAARYGCFLIVPLKYDPDSLDRARLERLAQAVPMTTMDVNENVKAMFSPRSPAAVGTGYLLPLEVLTGPLGPGAEREGRRELAVSRGEACDAFTLGSSLLYVFHTRVAFLCLDLAFARMETLKAICNPGWARNDAAFFHFDQTGAKRPFSMEGWLTELLTPLGLRKFFDGEASCLLDAYAHIFAVAPQWFDSLETLRRITFNLHKMLSPDAPMEDAAEEDIRYVYAAKSLDRNAYRWGCCVTSQTIAYVTADEALDLEAERRAQAADSLPLVLLSLYEKYTCLRFTELIARLEKRDIRPLKDLMLNFQAFGTVAPANLSRWHNVKQIYANLLEVNDIPAAVQDVSAKLGILTARQEELQRNRSETVIHIITLFGIVSILASVLSIVQILSDGDILIWVSTALTAVMLALVTALAILRR